MIGYGHALLADFDLDPQKTHLNHGSYGAVPRTVAAAQQDWRQRVEANPTGFFRQDWPILVRQAADRLAVALGGHGKDWVFVDNATAGANAVIASLHLEPGDEVITTAEVYNAVRQALRHHTARHDASLIEVSIPIPVPDEDAVIEAIKARMTERTRAVFIDHVTSRSGILFPVAAVAALCRDTGVPVFVDGAHAPGMIDLDVPALGVDWYTGNGHKWLCAPRGCGFLWSHPRHQPAVHPVVISHGYGEGYRAEFDWIGTRDPSAWLSITAALEHHAALGGPQLRDRNRRLAWEMGALLSSRLGSETAAPAAMSGSMASLRLPTGPWRERLTDKGLLRTLDEQHGLIVSLNDIGGDAWLRVSGAAYNELTDCDRLLEGLSKLGIS